MTDSVKQKAVNLEDLNAHSKVLFNKGIGNRGTCTTASATAAKAVTFGTTFSLADGATALVRFTYGISAENATLAVTYTDSAGQSQTTAAKAIYYRGAALPGGMVQAKDSLLLKYNGTQWDIIGSLNAQPEVNLLDLLSLAHDYTFKKGDTLFVGGSLYRCTSDSTSKPPFDFVFDSSNRIAVHTINGQDAVVCSSNTLNTGWEKVMDISDRYYVEDRIKNRFDIITDTNAAVLGNGYGVCDTAALTTAKTVSIGNFILKTNGIISVRFTNAIGTADSTLNVSGTGAKAIRINGNSIQPGVVRPGNTVMLQYDGTYWNIVSLQGLEQSGAAGEFWVDLGLPSGLKWAKANLGSGKDGDFDNDPFTYNASFFSWGNTEGHLPDGTTFDYDFGTSSSGPYASTPGAKLTGNIPPSMDAARALLGAPWRMPTKDEFQELLDNCNYVQADGSTVIASSSSKLVTVSGIVGIYLRSKKNGNLIFFPACGSGEETSLNNKASIGRYWASTLNLSDFSYCLGFGSSWCSADESGGTYEGLSIRPVF